MGRKGKAHTAKVKAVKKIAQNQGKTIGIKHASKIVRKSDTTGQDLNDLGRSIISAVPGGSAITGIADFVSKQTGIGQPMAQGGRGGGGRGLKIVDGDGNTLRRVSMEDYFYLKSLKNRRKLGTHHHRSRKAIVVGAGEKVVTY